MQVVPELQFQISLLNIASLGTARQQAQELEELLHEQKLIEKS
jgi:hypothetical protein